MKKILENVWAQLVMMAAGSLLAAQFQRVRETIMSALQDPVGAFGVILLIIGMAGLIRSLAIQAERKRNKRDAAMLIEGVFAFLGHYTRTAEMLPHLQDADIKARLRDVELKADAIKLDLVRFLSED